MTFCPSSNYYAAFASLSRSLLLENMAGALMLSKTTLPLDLEGHNPESMAGFLSGLAGRLHDLDGKLKRPPAQSLYFRLLCGAAERPPPPADDAASREFFDAASRRLLEGAGGGNERGAGVLFAASMIVLAGCNGAEAGFGAAALAASVLGAAYAASRIVSRRRRQREAEATDERGREVFLSRRAEVGDEAVRFDLEHQVSLDEIRFRSDGKIEARLQLLSLMDSVFNRVEGAANRRPRPETYVLSRRKAEELGLLIGGRLAAREEFGTVAMRIESRLSPSNL